VEIAIDLEQEEVLNFKSL